MDAAATWRRRLGRGVTLVIGLAALGVVVLVLYAGGLGQVLGTLRRLPLRWLLVAVLAIALEWWTDAARFAVMASVLGVRARLRWWLALALANMSATYAASAGTPLTAFLLTRRGVSTGKAIAFALVQQTLFVPACLAPACLLTLLYPDVVPPGLFRSTLWLAGIVALAVMVALLALALWPAASLRLSLWVSRGRARGAIEDFVAGVSSILRSRPGLLVASTLFSMINQAAVAGASVALLFGLGAAGSPARAWGFSYLFAAVSQSAPTPGGAGVSEIGGAWLFHDLLPAAAVAVHLVLWRFLAIQLPIIVGGLWIAAELRKPVAPT
jgi:uncharacterized protein (TIRG00374 family)